VFTTGAPAFHSPTSQQQLQHGCGAQQQQQQQQQQRQVTTAKAGAAASARQELLRDVFENAACIAARCMLLHHKKVLISAQGWFTHCMQTVCTPQPYAVLQNESSTFVCMLSAAPECENKQ
jgi:hypothetical protein